MKHIINKIQIERKKLDINTATCSQHELTTEQYLLVGKWLVENFSSFSVNFNNNIAVIKIGF